LSDYDSEKLQKGRNDVNRSISNKTGIEGTGVQSTQSASRTANNLQADQQVKQLNIDD